MARITVEDCLNRIDNRFELVLMATQRARMITKGAEPMVELEDDKPTVLALREIADGLIDRETLDELERREREASEAEVWGMEEEGPPPLA